MEIKNLRSEIFLPTCIDPKYPKITPGPDYSTWVYMQYYMDNSIKYTNKLNSTILRMDTILKGLSTTGKLFKLKSMEAQLNEAVTWFSPPNEDTRYINQLLEEIATYGHIQVRGTNTQSIEESFPVPGGRAFQPYSFDYPSWTPIQQTRKLEPVVKKTSHPDQQQRFTRGTT